MASLCEAWAAATTYREGIHRVNLLFDRATDAIRVTSPYSESGLTVTVLQPGPVFVRIPSWADREAMRPDGVVWHLCGEWLCIPAPVVGRTITISLPLPVRTIAVDSYIHNLRARLKGDIVLAMDNEGTDFTFFLPMEEADSEL